MSRRRTESDRLRSAAEKLTPVVNRVREYALDDHAAFLEGRGVNLSINFLKLVVSAKAAFEPFVLEQGHTMTGKLALEARALLSSIQFDFFRCESPPGVFLNPAEPGSNRRLWPPLEARASRKYSDALHYTFQHVPESSLTRLTEIATEMLECKAVPEPDSSVVESTSNVAGRGLKGNLTPEHYSTPPGTTWGNVTLTIYDDNTVNVRVKNGPSRDYKAEDLGLVDKRNGRPNFQWRILKELANSTAVECPTDPRERDRYDKRIKNLCSALQNFFGILNAKPITLRSEPIKDKELSEGSVRYKCWEPVLGLYFENSKPVARELGHM